MSRQIRRSRRARALQLALGLTLGLALHAAPAGAQGNTIEQTPPGNNTGNPPDEVEYDFETAIGNFSTADLKGDGDAEFAFWSGVVFGDSTSSNDPRIMAVDLGINALGEIGGYTLEEDGQPADPEFGGWLIDFDNDAQSRDLWKIEGGSLQVDSMGSVSGTIYVEGDTEPGQISYLQMNESRDVVAGVLNPDPNGGEAELVAFAKIDPAFDYATADLEGTWAVFVFSENTQANDPGAGHGVFEIDASGTVIGGSKDGPTGDEDWPPGLQFTIDAFGRIAETSGGLGGEPVLQLAQGRQIAVGSAIGFLQGGEDDHRIIFFVRETTGVVSSQLAGDFLVFSFEDDKQTNDPGTGQGGVTFDPTGTQLLGGSVTSSNEPQEVDFISPHTVDVQLDGEVTITPNDLEAWGIDWFGAVSNTPTGTGFTAISIGANHSLAQRDDGSIAAWGDDSDGQVSNTPTDAGYIAISAGALHNLALRVDGSIVAWGGDDYLDLESSSPCSAQWLPAGQVSNTPTDTGYIAISAGAFHNLALRVDGSIVAWGADMFGVVSNTPTDTGYTAISAGIFHNLALRVDGSIVAWGGNDYPFGLGQAGQVSNTPTGTGYTAVSTGHFHSLALHDDGSMVAWGGDSTIDEVGCSTGSTQLRPTGQVSNTPTDTGYIAISTGDFHSLALRDEGSIVGWGDDTYGQAGTPDPGDQFVAIAAGSGGNLALRRDDSPLTFQFSPEAGMMIGTEVTEGDKAHIILAFVPEPGAGLLGLAALAVIGALGRHRLRP